MVIGGSNIVLSELGTVQIRQLLHFSLQINLLHETEFESWWICSDTITLKWQPLDSYDFKDRVLHCCCTRNWSNLRSAFAIWRFQRHLKPCYHSGMILARGAALFARGTGRLWECTQEQHWLAYSLKCFRHIGVYYSKSLVCDAGKELLPDVSATMRSKAIFLSYRSSMWSWHCVGRTPFRV